MTPMVPFQVVMQILQKQQNAWEIWHMLALEDFTGSGKPVCSILSIPNLWIALWYNSPNFLIEIVIFD